MLMQSENLLRTREYHSYLCQDDGPRTTFHSVVVVVVVDDDFVVVLVSIAVFPDFLHHLDLDGDSLHMVC